ncbi:MAG: alpha/beta fold hydrolase [Proteobacteria bacterium]|nr:alpha/beta fold hydrolase [Pseudomonadota bacterium]
MKPHHKKQGVGRELDAFAPEGPSGLTDDAPDGAVAYRYSCPVDYAGHFVNVRGWRVEGDLTAPAFLLIHDVGEDTRMYRSCAYYLASKGFSCYGYDQRGHGESTGSMGRILSFDHLVQDLLQVVAWIRHLHNRVPPVIVGQGYGCLVGSEMIVKYPEVASAIVLSAPTVELAKDLSPSRRLLIKLFGEAAPHLRLPKILRPRFSNPRHRPVEQTMASRLMKSLMSEDDLKISGGFAWELLTAMERFPTILESIAKPTLVVLPEADEVARFERVISILESHPERHFLERLPIPNLHHNAFTESESSMKTVADAIMQWSQRNFARHTLKGESLL